MSTLRDKIDNLSIVPWTLTFMLALIASFGLVFLFLLMIGL